LSLKYVVGIAGELKRPMSCTFVWKNATNSSDSWKMNARRLVITAYPETFGDRVIIIIIIIIIITGWPQGLESP